MKKEDIRRMKSGPTMNMLIARFVMEWPEIGTPENYLLSMGTVWFRKDGEIYWIKDGIVRIWSPSTSIADAWIVIEEMNTVKTPADNKEDYERWVKFHDDLSDAGPLWGLPSEQASHWISQAALIASAKLLE